MSLWPTTGATLTALNIALFMPTVYITVTVQQPASGATVAGLPISVAWNFTPGTQNDYRIVVYANDGVTVIYDSGVITSSAQIGQIPVSAPLVSGVTYKIQVTIHTTDAPPKTGQSVIQTFSFVTAAPAALTGVTATATPAGPPPYTNVAWNTVADPAPDLFAHYSVYRAMPGDAAPGTRIATITVRATGSYKDYACPPGALATYTVTQSHWVSALLVESAAVTATATLSFDNAWLHDVAAVAQYVELPTATAQISSEQPESAFMRARGRSAPTLYVNEHDARTVSLTLTVQGLASTAVWTGLLNLQGRQRLNASVLCLRLGWSSQRLFVQFDPRVGRQDTPTIYAPSAVLREVYFAEAV